MNGLSDDEKRRLQEYLAESSKARSEAENKFYAAVGRGISNWSKMESRLVSITAKLLRTTEPKAGLVMYSIMNAHTWFQIIDDLFVLDGTFPKSLKMWRGIKEDLKAANDMRVQLAHHAIAQDVLVLLLMGGVPHFKLKAGSLDTRTKTKKQKPLTTAEIEDLSDQVNKLHVRLRVLLLRMKKRKSLR
jgi:hypothetical protein